MNQTRRIGDMTVTRIEEMYGPGFPAADFFPEFDRAVFDSHVHWLAPHYYDAPSGRLKASIHSWVVKIGSFTVLIDACSGNHKPRPAMPRFNMLETPYLERLKAAGVAPEEVDCVMCTHLHVDHVGWNTKLENGRWVPTFPNAKYLMSRVDHDFFAPSGAGNAVGESAAIYADSVLPVVESGQAVLVEPGHVIDDCLHVHAAPGHTPGHAIVKAKSAGARAIFSGDSMHNPLQVYEPHWNSCFCEDRAEAEASRRAILEECAETGALLMPAHFGTPHACRIQRKGAGFAIDWDHV